MIYDRQKAGCKTSAEQDYGKCSWVGGEFLGYKIMEFKIYIKTYICSCIFVSLMFSLH